MTFCLGIRTRTHLIGLADRRITSGNQTTTARKITTYQKPRHTLFIMTSGLRSVRDKALTYFNDAMTEHDASFNKVYKAVNAFAEQLRRVADEDKRALAESGLHFNLNALIGGQFEDDEDHKLYMLYPEGNWLEVGVATPFFIIGNTGYGKPILDRALDVESTLGFALKAAFLSFDATRLSTNDVGFPVDVIVYARNSFKIVEERYDEEEMGVISKKWNEAVVRSIHGIDGGWIDRISTKMG